MNSYNNFKPNTDVYNFCLIKFEHADRTILDCNKRRDYKIKAFCEVLKYHSEILLKPLAELNLDPNKIPSWIGLNNTINRKIIDFAKDGIWLDEAFSTYYKSKLEDYVDPKVRRYTYDINGNEINIKANLFKIQIPKTEIPKTHNYNLRPRPIVKKKLN